jgi:hypothetical protein
MPLSVRFRTDSAMTPMILSEEHKAVLLVVIGHRQKGGVSKRRVGEILGLIVVLLMTVGVWQGVNIWNSELQMPDWLRKL